MNSSRGYICCSRVCQTASKVSRRSRLSSKDFSRLETARLGERLFATTAHIALRERTPLALAPRPFLSLSSYIILLNQEHWLPDTRLLGIVVDYTGRDIWARTGAVSEDMTDIYLHPLLRVASSLYLIIHDNFSRTIKLFHQDEELPWRGHLTPRGPRTTDVLVRLVQSWGWPSTLDPGSLIGNLRHGQYKA
jgi:hypothetical protein